MAHGPADFLYLRVDPAQAGVREQLLRLGAEVAPSLRHAAIPLGEVRPEEILAECRQLGIRVLASAVSGAPPPG
jgi:hypothetical protein